MKRRMLKRCAEYGLLIAALASGSFVTAFAPKDGPQTASSPSAKSNFDQASTHDTARDLTSFDAALRCGHAHLFTSLS